MKPEDKNVSFISLNPLEIMLSLSVENDLQLVGSTCSTPPLLYNH